MGVCFESLRFIELGVFLKYAGQPFDFIFQQMKWTIISRMCVGGVFVLGNTSFETSVEEIYVKAIHWFVELALEFGTFRILILKFKNLHVVISIDNIQILSPLINLRRSMLTVSRISPCSSLISSCKVLVIVRTLAHPNSHISVDP